MSLNQNIWLREKKVAKIGQTLETRPPPGTTTFPSVQGLLFDHRKKRRFGCNFMLVCLCSCLVWLCCRFYVGVKNLGREEGRRRKVFAADNCVELFIGAVNRIW